MVSWPQRKLTYKKQLVAYSFLAPNFIGFAIFTLVPISLCRCPAFLRWDGANPIEWAGLSNFTELFDDDQFKAALKNTIVLHRRHRSLYPAGQLVSGSYS
jgi:multiple sugar transport system permease protein